MFFNSFRKFPISKSIEELFLSVKVDIRLKLLKGKRPLKLETILGKDPSVHLLEE